MEIDTILPIKIKDRSNTGKNKIFNATDIKTSGAVAWNA